MYGRGGITKSTGGEGGRENGVEDLESAGDEGGVGDGDRAGDGTDELAGDP